MNGSFEDILPFVRNSPNLTEVLLSHQIDSNFDVVPIIEKLNQERMNLINAKKAIIFVAENVYLKVKWAKNETNWNLIEIKRDPLLWIL